VSGDRKRPDDEFDEEEREALHRALDEGIAAARAGDHVDAEDFARELLARK
jgi:predicted transcriptional regulator